MGYTISYKRFFTVRIKEEGSGNAVRSLKFVPTDTCETLMNKHQLVFKPMDDGFDVYYKSLPEASEQIPAPIENSIKFTFGFKILDPSFTSKYEPDSVTVPQFYLDNLQSNGSITSGTNLTASTHLDTGDLTFIKQQSFTQRTTLPLGNEPSEWRIKEKFGSATLQTVPFAIPTDPNMPSIEVRLNDPDLHQAEYLSDQGPYLLETNKPDPAPVTIYLNNWVKQNDFNGVLDIHWNSIQSSVPGDTGKAYQIIVKLK